MFDQMPESSKVWDKVLRRQQILAKQLERTATVVAQITCCQGGGGDTLMPAPAVSLAPQLFAEMPSPQSIHQVFDQMTHQIGNWDNLDNEQGDASTWLPERQVISDGYEVFAEMPMEVAWDDELIHNSDSHDGLLQQLAQGGEFLDADEGKQTAQLLINGGFSEMSPEMVISDDEVMSGLDMHNNWQLLAMGKVQLNSEKAKPTVEFDDVEGIVWDEEVSSHLDNSDDLAIHEGLLQQLAHGTVEEMCPDHGREDLFDKEMQLNAELNQVSNTSLLVEPNIDTAVLNELPHIDVVWDDESLPIENSTAGCVEVAFRAEELFEDMPTKIIVWDEKPTNINSHDGLLQQLACGKKYVNAKNTEPIVSLEMGMGAVEHILLPMPNLDMNNDTMHVEGIPTWLYGGFSPGKIELQVDHWMAKRQGGTLVAEQFDYKLKVVQQDGSKNHLLLFDKQTKFFGEVKEPAQHSMVNGEIPWSGKQVGDYLWGMRPMQRVYQLLSPVMNSEKYLYEAVQMGKMEFNVASSVRRQWDPGIMQVHVLQWIWCEHKFYNVRYSWTRCYDVAGKKLLNTATAWGQAVFRGGGNVMTQRWPRRSLRRSSPSDGPGCSPRAKPGDDCVVYKKLLVGKGSSIRYSETEREEEIGRASSSSDQRSYPSDSSVISHAPGRSRRCSHGLLQSRGGGLEAGGGLVLQMARGETAIEVAKGRHYFFSD